VRDVAKIGLGKRGPVWWDDGEPDYNRRLIQNSPHAMWWIAEGANEETWLITNRSFRLRLTDELKDTGDVGRHDNAHLQLAGLFAMTLLMDRVD